MTASLRDPATASRPEALGDIGASALRASASMP